MSHEISLKEAERKAFQMTFQDGLVDIFIGTVVLMFAVAPFFSQKLGDFWSSAVFLPFWLVVYLVILVLKRYVVRPRLGVVKFRLPRRRKLMWFNIVILIVNLAGLITAFVVGRSEGTPGMSTVVWFGLLVLVVSSLAGYFLDFPALFVYGLLIAASPFIGEWFYLNLGAAHHGYPITFGITTGIILTAGLIKFARFLRAYPEPDMEGTSNSG